jgi:hypothetical protein
MRSFSSLIRFVRFVAIGAVFGVAQLTGSVAAAQEIPAPSAKDLLPSTGLYTPDDVGKNLSRQQLTPHGNSKLSFEILVPKGWQSEVSEIEPDQLTHDDQAPVPMAGFYPTNADDAWAVTLYIRLPQDVSLASFIDRMLAKDGGTLVTRQATNFNGRAVEEALVRADNEDLGSILRRITVMRRGDILFIVIGTAAEGEYPKYKRNLGVMATSFTPAEK